jgi:hypothetical protein
VISPGPGEASRLTPHPSGYPQPVGRLRENLIAPALIQFDGCLGFAPGGFGRFKRSLQLAALGFQGLDPGTSLQLTFSSS